MADPKIILPEVELRDPPVKPGHVTDDGAPSPDTGPPNIVDILVDPFNFVPPPIDGDFQYSPEMARVEQRQQDGGLEEFFVATFDDGIGASADDNDDIFSGASAITDRAALGSGFHFEQISTTLFGDDVFFCLNGYGGNDTLTGGNNIDIISGDSGNDTLTGLGGDDHILGGTGDDRIFGDNGEDLLEGGSGNDEIHGGADNDSITANSGDDQVFGDGGDDVIYTNSGNDTVFGGEGDDNIRAGGDDDFVSGGLGDDVIRGGSGDDRIEGNEGDDLIDGGPGDDVIDGGEGNDQIIGNDGDDTINGGADDDLIDGSAGDDLLTGGGGRDVFLWDSATAGEVFGDDIITDFTDTGRESDQIDLTCIENLSRIIVETVDQPDDSIDQTQERAILSLEDALGNDIGTIEVNTGGRLNSGADSFLNQPGAFSTGEGATVQVNSGVQVIFESVPITDGIFVV